MKAREIMSTPVVSVRDTATLADAAKLMIEHRVGGLAVVDEAGQIVGFITDSDFAAKERGVPFSLFRAPQVLGEWLGPEGIERVYDRARSFVVRDFMSHPAMCASEDASVEEVARLMMRDDINRIVIAREGRPIGIVARHDLVRLLVKGTSVP